MTPLDPVTDVAVTGGVPVAAQSSVTPPATALAGWAASFTALLKDTDGNVNALELPLEFKWLDADGVEASSTVEYDLAPETGLRTFSLTAPTLSGTTTVTVWVDGVLLLSVPGTEISATVPVSAESSLSLPPAADVINGTSVPVTVHLRDEYGNPTFADVVSVTLYEGMSNEATVTATLVPESPGDFSASVFLSAVGTVTVNAYTGTSTADLSLLTTGSLTVLTGPPNVDETTVTLPSSVLDAGTPFDVSVVLKDVGGVTIVGDKSVSLVFADSAGTSVTIAAAYNASTNVYAVTSTAELHDVADDYTVDVVVGGETLLTVADTLTVEPAAPVPEATEVVAAEDSTSRKGEVKKFFVRIKDVFGNLFKKKRRSLWATKQDLPDTTVYVGGDGWSDSQVAVWSDEDDEWVVELKLQGTGTASFSVSVDNATPVALPSTEVITVLVPAAAAVTGQPLSLSKEEAMDLESGSVDAVPIEAVPEGEAGEATESEEVPGDASNQAILVPLVAVLPVVPVVATLPMAPVIQATDDREI
ncbi:hypothetical protein KIPB_010186 [Kipferlia bialata]|uniref:Big-1 domain-containing protein n=1 Tax=Kipferlia bialata TaxID=797122 RepID=A0A9K3D678_9EUKA|nr:hypothetical protein KIPB_010186 [Kipferlia bialata]|eukprot:g10186.t1